MTPNEIHDFATVSLPDVGCPSLALGSSASLDEFPVAIRMVVRDERGTVVGGATGFGLYAEEARVLADTLAAMVDPDDPDEFSTDLVERLREFHRIVRTSDPE